MNHRRTLRSLKIMLKRKETIRILLLIAQYLIYQAGLRIREDPGFFQLLDPDPEKRSQIRRKFVRNCLFSSKILTNSMVKTGLRIRIRDFFSSWIRIRIRENILGRIRIREKNSRIRNSVYIISTISYIFYFMYLLRTRVSTESYC